jgi:DNA-binding transcriptional MerR regulator
MSYTATEAARIAGISYRQLDYWDRTELISPSAAEAHGSGSRRSYSHRDLIDLCIVKAMLDANIALSAVRTAMLVLQRHQDLDVRNLTLVMSGRDVRLCSQDELVDLVRSQRSMLNVLPLGGILDQLDSEMHERILVDAARR